ncbi:MAG TPA: hypothetical protein DCP54_03820, partial [Chryseobacterium sp.]|nr:hypothetical protein [Chryseobacterium sp.]
VNQSGSKFIGNQKLQETVYLLEKAYLTGSVRMVLKTGLQAENISLTENDSTAILYIKRYLAWAYTKLGLYDKARIEIEEIKVSAGRIKDPTLKTLTSILIYSAEASLFEARDMDIDSMERCSLIAYNLTKSLPESFQERPKYILMTTVTLGSIYAYKGEIFSAREKKNEALELLEGLSNPLLLTRVKKLEGMIESKARNYEGAIPKYLSALNNARSQHQFEEMRNILPMLANSYAQLHNYEKSVFAMNSFKSLSDSIKSDYQSIFNDFLIIPIGVPSGSIVNGRKHIPWGWITFFSLLLIVISLIFIRFWKLNRNAPLTVSSLKSIKHNRSYSIDQGPSIEILKRLNDASNISQKAFYAYFIEVYPDFQSRLLSSYPDLIKSELLILSLIKMNYDTKEIARITHSSIKSIESKKYRIRKKMRLGPKEDIYLVIDNI